MTSFPVTSNESRHSNEYYCKINNLAVAHNLIDFRITVDIEAFGDGSNGPVQYAESSRLVINNEKFPPLYFICHEQNPNYIKGSLVYYLAYQKGFNQSLYFEYGLGGYSHASLTMINTHAIANCAYAPARIQIQVMSSYSKSKRGQCVVSTTRVCRIPNSDDIHIILEISATCENLSSPKESFLRIGNSQNPKQFKPISAFCFRQEKDKIVAQLVFQVPYADVENEQISYLYNALFSKVVLFTANSDTLEM